MNSIQFFITTLLVVVDHHITQALNITNISVPRVIDISQKAKLFCSYDMGNRTLNSVKWYKDGQEFFRYSPLTPPTTNVFPVKGIAIAEGSSLCNQFMCNVELEKLSASSSGSYRCEVSGDAPEFKLIDKTENMTVGVLPRNEPYISDIRPAYQYSETIVVNCSTEWSYPPATLTWYINNKTAPSKSLLPQINEISRNPDGFQLFSSRLQLRIHIDDIRFKHKTEVLELKCVANIAGAPSSRRQSRVNVIIAALRNAAHKQRLLGQEADNGSQRGAAALKFFLCCFGLLTMSNWLQGSIWLGNLRTYHQHQQHRQRHICSS